MALEKQAANISFGQGVDTKSDPWQVPAGKLLNLENAVFNRNNLLEKRKGFEDLVQINFPVKNLSTLNNTLLATGKNLYSLSSTTNTWSDKGLIEAVDLRVESLARTEEAIESVDAVVSESGLVCSVFSEGGASYYQITEQATGQQIVPAVALDAGGSLFRTFILRQWFIISYMTNDTVDKLRFIAIPIANPNMPMAPMDISTQVSSDTAFYDGVVANDTFYVAWDSSDMGGGVRIAYINSSLIVSSSIRISNTAGDLIALANDQASPNPIIYVTYYDAAGTTIYYRILDQTLLSLLAETSVNAIVTALNLTIQVNNGTGEIYYEVDNAYTYAAINSNYIQKNTVDNAGNVGSNTVVIRSVGLASKAFFINDTIYMLTTYNSDLQPTYFLINSSGQVVTKLAYQNAFGYILQLPNVSIHNLTASIAYLRKTQIQAVNKSQGAANVSGIYALTGADLATFTFDVKQYSQETAFSAHMTGGQLWQYDGVKPVELGFHLYPEDLLATSSTGTGSMTAQQYFYIFTYEWTDAYGNIHRSAPSIPLGVLLVGPDDTVTIDIPTLRVTAKTGINNLRIVGYRWSTAQQTYYECTSILMPIINDVSIDSVSFVDDQADSDILGNNILYTTGGVIENIAPPANISQVLYKNRLFLVDAENRNSIWYSKQIIQNTPVEMSDLFTIYIPPTFEAKGGITALASMDDKLIIFKADAIYYLVGIGPDNAGNNNDFTDPVFITSTVGVTNQSSIVSTPAGLMFQSDKGIWLLGRDLSTNYIGADVEAYNNFNVTSAVSIPGTNQIRFSLDNRRFLVYDYYFNQWGTFTFLEAIDSLIYQGRHTYIEDDGQIRQESLSQYLDGSKPVLMSFTTAWLKLTNLQGFQRTYFFYLLANYLTPHKLAVNVAYDYNEAPSQTSIINPFNFNPAWGSDVVWGASSPWGGQSSVEQFRIFLSKQKCQSIQISVSEIFDPSKNVPAGAGLTFSGLNIVIGAKKGFPTLPAKQSVG
jgi:hypothetical protein